ncbi:MAG: hypothetical protein OEW08_11410, partial [Gammaproteobacteria bacterium]|nr:hypothetical protein [Gammaproteobacteria bacterium]
MEQDRAELIRQTLAILQRHAGPEHAITMYELWTQITGHHLVPWRKVDQTRIVRSIIEQLRRAGH